MTTYGVSLTAHIYVWVLCQCVCVCGLSTIHVTGWLGFYEGEGQQELGRVTLLLRGSNRGENYHDPTNLNFTVSSTWIYADIPPLLPVCFFPLYIFSFFLKEFSRMCSHQILSHVHCIRWWFFSPAKVETKLFSPVLENQKGRMLFRSWKGSCGSRGTLHQGQWDFCSLESSEVMNIFKFVSSDAKR